MARLPTTYHQITDLVNLGHEDLQAIEVHAQTLTLDECLQFLLINKDDVAEADLSTAKRVWQRGRLLAVTKAGDRLFANMGTKGGAQASLDYLRQMSPTFQAEITSKPSGGFKFNVVLDE